MGTAQHILIELVNGNERLASIASAIGKTRADVVQGVQCLKHRGLAESRALGVYAATDAGRTFLAEGRTVASGQTATRPRRQTRGLRQRAWWVIRARRTVSVPDLLLTLADGSEKNAGANLSRYFSALVRTGFMVELPRQPGSSPTSNGYKRYLLVRDNGRQAPVVRQRQSMVFDPNSGKAFPLGKNEEEPS